jgi:hypothetical protein
MSSLNGSDSGAGLDQQRIGQHVDRAVIGRHTGVLQSLSQFQKAVDVRDRKSVGTSCCRAPAQTSDCRQQRRDMGDFVIPDLLQKREHAGTKLSGEASETSG